MNEVAPKPSPPLRLEYRSPSELAENPANWRTHPDSQLAVLEDVFAEVGWAGALLYNERTGRLVDGHARRGQAALRGDELVPVLIGSWTEEQERLILATFDPVGDMAEVDSTKLGDLIGEMDAEEEAVANLLNELREQIQPGGLPGTALGMSGPSQQSVKAILVVDQIAIVERALAATGEAQRGKALVAVCEAYLDAQG